MMALKYLPDDYDHKGQLRLPWLFWFILLLQARTWILLLMAGASRQQGNDLLLLFYPDQQRFWIGLALGVPAALGLLLSLFWQGAALVEETRLLSPLPLLLSLFDLLALGWLHYNPRLRDCFRPEYHQV